MSRTDKIRICLVEDEKLLLETLRWAFHRAADFEVCGALPSAELALRTVKWASVDVLVADLELPGMNGGDLVCRLSQEFPGLKILVLTGREDRATVLSAIRRGACGYLVKGQPATEIVAAVREMVGGGAPMSPQVARMLLEELRGGAGRLTGEETTGNSFLTRRETEIVRWIALGHTRHQIGETLSISSATVHSHIKNIYSKLRAHNKTEAMNRARDLKIL